MIQVEKGDFVLFKVKVRGGSGYKNVTRKVLKVKDGMVSVNYNGPSAYTFPITH